MNNIYDNENKTNWPLIVTGMGTTQISATMAGQAGFNDVTIPAPRTGVLTDANGNSFNVALPALIAQPGTLNVAFQRI